MKDVQCYELFGGIALKIHTFSFSFFTAACCCQRLRLKAATRSYIASKQDIPKTQVDSQVALLVARTYSLLNGMLHFLRIDSM